MESKICLISDHDELTNLVKKLDYPWQKNIIIREALGHQAFEIGQALEKNGVEAIITTGVNVQYLKDRLKIPVVAIPITTYDLICTFKEVKKLCNKVALIQLLHSNRRISVVSEILDMEIGEFVFQTEEEMPAKMSEAVSRGFNHFVGGAVTCRTAKKLGYYATPFRIRGDAIAVAIKNAVELIKIRANERREVLELKALIDFAFEGIITTNKQGIIRMINPQASKLLELPMDKALGKNINYLIKELNIQRSEPQIVMLLGKKIVVSCVPVLVDNQIDEIVIHIQDIGKVQSLEGTIRREVYAKGHVARYHFDDIVGKSVLIKNAISYAKGYAGIEETVLIEGESGTGKEVFAQSIHNASSRAGQAFVAVNCASLQGNLLESELFGYVEGAFTGAKRGGKPGLFEIAHNGTIFLDEIGDISSSLQVKLLRVLQEKQIMRIGDDKVIPVNVRVIAATNRKLLEMVKAGQFRYDLYYRLNVLQLVLPSLRERKGDISELVCYFLGDWLEEFNQNPVEFNLILKRLSNYHWPGNIRELENFIIRFKALVRVKRGLAVETLNEVVEGLEFDNTELVAYGNGQPKDLRTIESLTIADAYKNFNGSKAELAKHLGISRTTLWRRLKEEQRLRKK